ncbi:MAG: helix-turn-helix domain-containing protein [Cyclobacteriaceae bacterium]|uniref:helix-turn-helix domain-containing protein n=1 Tax=Reichenbachiella sp. TaxID=2184521 RepID=UPI003262EBEA
MKTIIGECLEEFLQDNEDFLEDQLRGIDPLELLTIADTCSLLKVSKMTLYQHIRSGKLKKIRIGYNSRSPVRFRRMDLEKFINQHVEKK